MRGFGFWSLGLCVFQNGAFAVFEKAGGPYKYSAMIQGLRRDITAHYYDPSVTRLLVLLGLGCCNVWISG